MNETAFVDTNIFIRYLVNDDMVKARACRDLFKRSYQSDLTLMTCEAVVSEIVHVLMSSKQYALSREDIYNRLNPVFSLPGLKIDQRINLATYLRATDIFRQHTIDFEDCVILTHMEQLNLKTIYSYDRDFDQFDQVTRLEPQPSEQNEANVVESTPEQESIQEDTTS